MGLSIGGMMTVVKLSSMTSSDTVCAVVQSGAASALEGTATPVRITSARILCIEVKRQGRLMKFPHDGSGIVCDQVAAKRADQGTIREDPVRMPKRAVFTD
jgi:hypothetical protein